MTLREAKQIILGGRGVDRVIVQLTEGEWPKKAAKNSGGGWDYGTEDLREVRVAIGTGERFADHSGSSLKEAATGALTTLGMPIPEEFATP